MPTVKQLKKTLTAANVDFSGKAKKAELQKLIDALPEIEVPPKKTPPSSENIKIDVNVTMQDGSVHKKALSIANPGGCIMKSQLGNPDKVFEMIKKGLVLMYGANHIKG